MAQAHQVGALGGDGRVPAAREAGMDGVEACLGMRAGGHCRAGGGKRRAHARGLCRRDGAAWAVPCGKRGGSCGALGVDPALGFVDHLRLRAAGGEHLREQPCRHIRALPWRAGGGGHHGGLRVDARRQHLRAAPAGADAEAAFGEADEPRLLAFRRERADERVAVHGELEPAAERRLVDDGHRRDAERWYGGERSRAALEVDVQAGVVERVDLRQVSARDEHARAGRREHQAGAALAGNLRAGVGDGADQPCIKHHHAATRFRWIWLKPKRDNTVGVTIDSEGCGHLGESTENQV